METQLILTVLCTTYNHKDYIRQCLDGIVMQRTNFHFEAVVHDDASTDGTSDIVREYAEKYPNIITPIIQPENLFSKRDGSLRKALMAACRGKYIANLEGDDYWTDPLKLQKQVDYLENHPNCGLVRTDFNRYYQVEGKLEIGMFPIMRSMTDSHQDYILNARFAGPCTWVYKAKYDQNLMADLDSSKYFKGDLALLLEISKHEEIVLLPDNTAVYRILSESASHTTSKTKSFDFLTRLINTRMYYACMQPLLFRFQFWLRISRSYRSVYINAGKTTDWINMCIIIFCKLFCRFR